MAAFAAVVAWAAAAEGMEWGPAADDDWDVLSEIAGEWDAAPADGDAPVAPAAAAADGDAPAASGIDWDAPVARGGGWDAPVSGRNDWDAPGAYGGGWGAARGLRPDGGRDAPDSGWSAWDGDDDWDTDNLDGGEWDETVARLKKNTLKLRFRGVLGDRTGAGFYVDTNGWVLTNLSIAEGAKDGYAETSSGERLAIKRVVGMSPRFNLMLLDLGGEREDALELADDDALRTGMAAHAIGMTSFWGWSDLAGVVTRIGEDDAGMPLVEFSGWRGAPTAGGPVAGADGRVIAIGTWKAARSPGMDGRDLPFTGMPGAQSGCIPAALARRFLESPHSGMSLQELGSFHANAAIANWVMLMCSELTEAMLALRKEVKAAGMEKDQILDIKKVSFRKTLWTPIHWKNMEGIEEAKKQLEEVNALAGRSRPFSGATDVRARNAAAYFKSALQAMDESVAFIEKSEGMYGEGFWQKYEQLKGKFLQANDFLFRAMQNAMAAYQMYGRYTSLPASLTPGEARRLLRFLEKRGGAF